MISPVTIIDQTKYGISEYNSTAVKRIYDRYHKPTKETEIA